MFASRFFGKTQYRSNIHLRHGECSEGNGHVRNGGKQFDSCNKGFDGMGFESGRLKLRIGFDREPACHTSTEMAAMSGENHIVFLASEYCLTAFEIEVVHNANPDKSASIMGVNRAPPPKKKNP